MMQGALLNSIARSDLAAAAVTQVRVVGALMLREMLTRFGRTSLGYLWAVLGPILQIAVISALFYAISRNVPLGSSLALFIATGLLPYKTATNIASRVCSAISSNSALFTFPIVKPLDAIFARSILEAATLLSVCFIVLGGLWAIGLGAIPASPLEVAAAFSAMALLGIGVGSINAVINRFYPSWDKVWALGHRPLHMASGIWYLPDQLPQPILEILTWNPLLHGVGWFRAGFYAEYSPHTLDHEYLLKWGMLTLLIGLAAERALRARGNDQ